MRGEILLALVLISGCSEKEPTTTSSKSPGLRLSKSKRTPESLAHEFQKTLGTNDSDALMKLSLLGQGVKNWKIIASAQNARTLKLRESELAAINEIPREKRTEKEQTRFFALHSEIDKLEFSPAGGGLNLIQSVHFSACWFWSKLDFTNVLHTAIFLDVCISRRERPALNVTEEGLNWGSYRIASTRCWQSGHSSAKPPHHRACMACMQSDPSHDTSLFVVATV